MAPPVGLEPTRWLRLRYFCLSCIFVQSTPCSITVCAWRINRQLQTVATAFLRCALHLPQEASTPQTTSFATLSRYNARLLTALVLHKFNKRSTNKKEYRLVLFLVCGSPCWTRTNDNAVNSRVLYRLS